MLRKTTWSTRRSLLSVLAKALSLVPVIGLQACRGTSTSSTTNHRQITSDQHTTSSIGDDFHWLAGGTPAMRAAFPPKKDPFPSVPSTTGVCRILNASTIGPCFFAVDDSRDDISEGQLGVPMTLALQLLGEHCRAVADAQIDVWWCNAAGLYSGDNAKTEVSVSRFSSRFCTSNNKLALASRWFRGSKTTNKDGIVYFKACFPGWYRGRTTHIHLRVVINKTKQFITQLAFDDRLANQIYRTHPDYTGQEKDTDNGDDLVFTPATVNDYLFSVDRQSDGSMLAYKTLQINL